jgi:hypothetical protein
VAKFVSFVAGSFAALLLGLSLLDENLLEVPLGGRNVVWWLALTGILLTVRCALTCEKTFVCVALCWLFCAVKSVLFDRDLAHSQAQA